MVGWSARSCQAGLGSGGLEPTTAEHPRRDAVEGRRLVQTYERVRVAPVAADAVAAVDEGDPHVGVVDQGVDEPHPHRPRTDHEVVDVHTARHPITQARHRHPDQP